MTTLAPIALFVYNRPSHTRQTVEALLKNELAMESDLFIFSDAPKSESQAEAVREVRQYIHQIDGFKSVTIVERETNFGLARSIIDGVTRLCNEYGRVIVVEDDLIVSPDFLHYMTQSLDHYENEAQVMQVGGFTLSPPPGIATDAFLLPVTTTWGWATWQRAWQHFSWEPANLAAAKLDKNWRGLFDLNGTCAYSSMLEDRIAGRNDSWGILWWYAVSRRKGLVVYPTQSLVWNSGFDGSGIHCGSGDFFQQGNASNYLQTSLPATLKFPSAVRFEPAHLLQLEKFFRSRLSGGQQEQDDTSARMRLKAVAQKLKEKFRNAIY